MSYDAVVLSVLIASPGDTHSARDVIEHVVRRWNASRARSEGVVLLPLRWEVDAVSSVGRGDGQGVINEQLVENADIVVALFHSRLGSPTRRERSGTIEEIEGAIQRGASVHVYFSDMPIPRDVNPAQLEELNGFRDSLGGRGLLGSYASEVDLERSVLAALESDVMRFAESREGPDRSGLRRADLVASYHFSTSERTVPGSDRIESTRHSSYILIRNAGLAPAENVVPNLVSSGAGVAPRLVEKESLVIIPPGGEVKFPVHVAVGSSSSWTLSIAWEEGGRRASSTQELSARG